jgi:hypothetical protein
MMNTPALIQPRSSGAIIDSGDLVPVGVPLTALSDSILQTVAGLFPANRGLPFLSLLLSQAQVAQLTLPEVGECDVAVVSLGGNIGDFARSHHQSKDRALRYISVLHALGIISKKVTCGILHIPLVEWLPSPHIIEALDQLIATARHKLARLAASVKAKFLLLFGSPSTWGSLFHEAMSVAADLHAYLGRHISKAKRALLSSRWGRVCQQLENQKGDLSIDALLPDRNREMSLPGIASPFQKGDLSIVPPISQVPFPDQKGDLPQTDAPFPNRKGDLFSGVKAQKSQSANQKGDLPPCVDADVAPFSNQKGDLAAKPLLGVSTSLQSVDQKGDLEGVAATPNVNVNILTYITENITLNVRETALFMCRLFSEPQKLAGIYQRMFEKEGCNDPETVLAALFWTVTRRDSKTQTPAGSFISNCRKFHQDRIPDEARRAAKNLNWMTVADFLEELSKPATHPKPAFERNPPRIAAPSSPSATKPDLQVTLPLPESGGMAFRDFGDITAWLKEHLGMTSFLPVPLSDASWVIVVQGINQQILIRSRDEWLRSRDQLIEQALASRRPAQQLADRRRDEAAQLGLQPGGGMSWETAEKLRERLKCETGRPAERLMFSEKRIVALRDGSYALLIDASSKADGQRIAALYSEADWEHSEYLVTELLGPDVSAEKAVKYFV